MDCLTGPDGALYVADWYDKRANHVDPVDNWDRSNGRIYKVQARGAPPAAPIDPPLDKRSSKDLIALLAHPNEWYAAEARRILAERRDASVVPGLRKAVRDNEGRLALESLWALYVSGGFDEDFADRLLDHPDEDVRAWAIRLVGDGKKVSPGFRDRLVALARADKSAAVRCQLACSCKRLPGPDCLPIVRELLRREEDAADPFLPLLLWWAIEDKAISDRDIVLGLLDSPAAWRTPIVHQFIVERLARRYTDEGGEAGFTACARLLIAAPGRIETDLLLRGMDRALEGRRLEKVPEVLKKQLMEMRRDRPDDLTLLRLAVRMGAADAYDQALKQAGDGEASESNRIALIDLLGQMGNPDCLPTLLHALADARSDGLRGRPVRVTAVLRPAGRRRRAGDVPQVVAGVKGAGTDFVVRPGGIQSEIPRGRGRGADRSARGAAGQVALHGRVQGRSDRPTPRETLG